MAVQELPARSDIPSYEYQIDLDGTIYTLRFTFNRRMDRWVMDISDSNGNPLRVGIKVLSSWPLNRQYVADGLPTGKFLVVDTGAENENPKDDDFGIRKILTYIEEGTT